MDLNVECVDVNNGRVKIVFTDSEADEALRVYLTEKQAWELHEMIRAKCNWKAKEERGPANYNPNF